MSLRIKRLAAMLAFTVNTVIAVAQTDTIRLMTYNVLYYGDTPPCQAPHAVLHGYMKTIIEYVKPDVLGLVKMAAPTTENNKHGSAPTGFPDSVLKYALNVDNSRYAYCPYTNNAHGNNIAVLFYNQQKLGFSSVVCSYSNVTDFNTYKLFYRDADLGITHDTTFLYVTLNHDKSGDEFEKVRGAQIKSEMNNIKLYFSALPSMVNMGDFNTRGSDEACYQTLVFPDDTSFRFYDPPFYDGDIKYPAHWDDDRMAFSKYLTTSTRKTEGVPNDCGSAGGAKNWYDHIFLSSRIMNGADRIQYIPHSYRTVGNDGHRYKVSVNDKNVANTSAPTEVIEALFDMSNKYPIIADLAVIPKKVKGIKNTELNYAGEGIKEGITIVTATRDELVVRFSDGMLGEEIIIECLDDKGSTIFRSQLKIKTSEKHIVCKLEKGTYTLRFSTKHSLVSESNITVL